MKVLLVCFPRTGSTSISTYYKHANPNIKIFSEPFNFNGLEGYFPYKKVISYENVFVKHMYQQMPSDLKDLSYKELYDIFYKSFDKVVFLDRRNINEQVESLSNALVTNVWHSKYIYNDTISSTTLAEQLNNIAYWKGEFYKLAEEKNAKVFYYEDIYSSKENMLEFLSEIGSEYNEEYYNTYLDNSNKYRVYSKINSII